MRLFVIFVLIAITFLAGCAQQTASPEMLVTRIVITTTPKPSQTASPTLTPSATPTPTPTLTPTPTAPSISMDGNPRAYTLFDPVLQSGAPCGWADTFDFPLDPPNGEGATGGRDFGTYRDRYEKYHAGEDWGLTSRNNFGKPVYSIGHGQVTYAQPLGWGADKGVVIIRHTFPDGSSILSFYGHLDPPSVTLREGDCVWRGDLVGQIGRPRTPPHLHFEVRLHLPYATGGGYWPSDPTRAGWLPPSITVNQTRLQVSPGAVWTNAAPLESSLPLGVVNENIFVAIEDGRLVGINLSTGDKSWSFVLSEYIKNALLDPGRGVLYLYDVVGGLRAFPLPVEGEPLPEELEPLWRRSLPPSGRIDLAPLPGGGVLVGHKNALSAFSPDGDLLWESEDDQYIENWALTADSLIFTTGDHTASLKIADTEGIITWIGTATGIPLTAGEQTWLYAEDGLYQLDVGAQSFTRVYALPAALLRRSTALPLSEGGIALVHTDIADRRLLVFDTRGNLQYEFSLPLTGELHLLEAARELYVLSQPTTSSSGSYKTIEVFRVDFEKESLFRLFEGSTRAFDFRDTWAISLGEQGILMNIGGCGRILLDPQAALRRMGQ
ncbi:MAG TPA: hypothetical protein DEH25_03115 [Chloroflexi bacterium]|nr:hypothetical protein [Chloroflexota bacterium]